MLVDLSKLKNLKISCSFDTYQVLKHVFKTRRGFEKDKEHLYAIGLTRNNKIKYVDLISVGSLTGTIAHPREIFRMAIHKAVGGGIIIAHNHPSGNLTPSEHDKILTNTIKESGNILDIRLVDHIIFTGTGYYSFADEGEL
jgi:DNA repair protein RadC